MTARSGRSWRGISAVVVGLASVAAACPVSAQSLRAELGRRLQRFERSWQDAEPTKRAQAVEPMRAAVGSFFSLDLAAAAGHLDRAWYAVRPQGPPSDAEQSVTRYQLELSPQVVDAGDATIEMALAAVYPADGADEKDPANCPLVQLAIVDANGMTCAATERSFSQLLAKDRWTPGDLPAGDLQLVATCGLDGRQLEIGRRVVSRVPRLERRLEALGNRAAAPLEQPAATVTATIESICSLVRRVAEGRPQETDYPIARLVSFAERLALKPEGAIAAAAREADVWLTLGVGRDLLPVRLRAPEKGEGPRPLLVLLHGAGGSENMFFETCGAGRAVSLGLERNWIVVAPRQGLFGLTGGIEGIVDAVAAEFSVDRSRVFLIGHSMGAGQAARQVTRSPEQVAAAVALGGGGSVGGSPAAVQVPWFVAAGEFDFGRGGAESLARDIRTAGGRVVSRTYADVEHMVIVQAALDDVFRFLDDVADSVGEP